jgi:hypothetical protein
VRLTKAEWAKWQEWTHKIVDDLSPVVEDQDTAIKFDEIVHDNYEWILEHEGLWFCDFVRRSHVVAALLAIRRHLDIDGDAVSVLRLLQQLSMCAEQLTYDFYIEQFPLNTADEDAWQRFTFNAFAKDGETLDRTLVEEDIRKTEDMATRCRDLTTRTLAHLDKRGFSETVTYHEVRKVIDHFNDLVCKYLPLINGSGYSSLLGVKVYNWMRVFKHPLVKPGYSEPEKPGRIVIVEKS